MILAKDRDLSLFTQEYAKELFEGQGNIIYKDISRKSKAPHEDLILYGECWKQAHAIYAMKIMQWTLVLYSGEQRRVYSCKENFFGGCFQPLSRRYNFFVRVVISKTNASPNCKDQYLPKKRSRTNKRTAIKKTCLFFGLSKELHLT